MQSAGEQPCPYMHGWWKNVSLNGSQLSTALRKARPSHGNKICHIIIILIITLTLRCLPALYLNLNQLHA